MLASAGFGALFRHRFRRHSTSASSRPARTTARWGARSRRHGRERAGAGKSRSSPHGHRSAEPQMNPPGPQHQAFLAALGRPCHRPDQAQVRIGLHGHPRILLCWAYPHARHGAEGRTSSGQLVLRRRPGQPLPDAAQRDQPGRGGGRRVLLAVGLAALVGFTWWSLGDRDRRLALAIGYALHLSSGTSFGRSGAGGADGAGAHGGVRCMRVGRGDLRETTRWLSTLG